MNTLSKEKKEKIGGVTALLVGGPIGLAFSFVAFFASLMYTFTFLLILTGGGLIWNPIIFGGLLPLSFLILLWLSGKTISKNLRFYGFDNLKIFEKRINFVHPNKRKILTELINNYKRLKLHSEDRDRIFIKTLKRQDFLTAKEISAKVNMHHRSTLNYLNKLKDRKMIARTYDTWPNKWHLTKN